MVTVLAGPVDKLSAGLIAGMKIADQRNRTKVLRERNQMMAEQLLMQERRQQQQVALNASTVAANDSRINLQGMQARALEEGIDAKHQDQTEALASALAPADDTPTLAEALESDTDYFTVWKSNIAMAMFDAKGDTDLERCDKGAEAFLDLLILRSMESRQRLTRPQLHKDGQI